MVVIHNTVIQAQTVGYEFKQSTNKKVIEENDKVSNDYFWKTNQYTDKDVFGRTLDLTALINKPDGYLQGSLSDSWDCDYYKFNIAEYRNLGFVTDKYNVDITVTLDHIPAGCEYELILYDKEGNQVGIGKDNGNGGKSITIPNWSADNKSYTVKVQAKDGSAVNPNENYHLSFQTTQADKNHSAYQEQAEIAQYAGTVREQLHNGLTDTEEMRAIKAIREKYRTHYTEQMDKLHEEQAKEVLQGEALPNKEQLLDLLERKTAGETLTESENALLHIFCTAREIDSAEAGEKLNTTLKDKIFAELEQAGVDISEASFSIQIGADGRVSVTGIEDDSQREKAEMVLSKYADELMDIYFSMDSDIQDLPEQEKNLLKAAVDVEKFLYKATNGKVSLDDVEVENGIIKGISPSLDKLLNQPENNLTYTNYREDILLIKNYERTQHKKILSELNIGFCVKNGEFQIKDKESL